MALPSGKLIAAEGDLDPQIGNAGLSVIHTPQIADTLPAAVAVVPGGLVLAGSTGTGICTDAVIMKMLNDGAIDTTFGDHGILQAPLSTGDNWLNTVIPLPDGSLLAAGAAYGEVTFNAVVIHVFTDGTVDAAFGVGGMARLPNLEVSAAITALGVQADGSILFAGNAYQNSGNSALYVGRLTALGALDSSFGSVGQLEPAGIGLDRVPRCVQQVHGEIEVVATDAFGNSCSSVLLTAEGSEDASYGSAGVVLSSLLDAPKGAVIAADGSCAFVGSDPADGNAAVLRLDPSGSPLASYGSGGLAEAAGTTGWTPACCQIDASGDVTACGDDGSLNGISGVFSLRMLPTGDLDPSFGVSGLNVFQVDSGVIPGVDAMAVLADGSSVVVGHRTGTAGYQVVDAIPVTAAGLRGDFTAGDIGSPGEAAAEISGGHQRCDALCIQEQANGTIMMAGITTIGATQIATSVRCTAAGTVDTTYGTNGFCMTSDARLVRIAGAVIAPDGSVFFVGDDESSSIQLGVLRVTAGGVVDPTFGNLGVAVSGSADYGTALAIQLQGNGDIVAAGDTSGIPGGSEFAVRFLPDGTPDPSFGANGIAVVPQLPPNYSNPWIAEVIDDAYGIYLTGDDGNLSLVRLLDDGTVDASFAPGGALALSSSIRPCLAVDASHRILIASDSGSSFPQALVLLQRVMPDGTFDESFGNNPVYGSTEQTIPGYHGWSCSGIACIPDGRTMLAGTVYNAAAQETTGSPHRSGDERMTTAVFTPLGFYDTSYCSTGYSISANGVLFDRAQACATTPHAQVITAFLSDWTPGVARILTVDQILLLSLSSSSIAGPSPANALVGTLSATDTFPNVTFTYSLVDSDGGLFALGGVAGDQLIATVPLSAAQTPTLSVTVRVTDSGSATTLQTFTIAVLPASTGGTTGSTGTTGTTATAGTTGTSGTSGSTGNQTTQATTSQSGSCGIGGGLALICLLVLTANHRQRMQW